MKKILATLIILMSILSCELTPGLEGYDDGYIEYMGLHDLQTVEEIVYFVFQYVRYVPDLLMHEARDFWQSPLQTYLWRAGDCEDYVILAMYLIYEYLEIKSGLVVGYLNGAGHAWLLCDGREWEVTKGFEITEENIQERIEDIDDLAEIIYKTIRVLDYDEVMIEATTTHNEK